ncbi:MAG: Kae1-associated serine/threonine protein kinase, partial [Thermoplasmata archaeon]|nr:Kae1-associated serine/threonine protein kinase [Thermoplasmata archaeon]
MALRLYQGAEAVIDRVVWLGVDAVEKRRISKGYRHPVLDSMLRAQRTRAEARILWAARDAGVEVPRVLDVDDSGLLVLEYVEGVRAKEWMETHRGEAAGFLRLVGRLVARLHRAGVVHGDLTTSNILVRSAGP